ncbi:hypothetical protein J1614_010176 [Plenodomus biglobosus]|nr:hypothetical protein J1614_010176 [Plenodomus biglobosus]
MALDPTPISPRELVAKRKRHINLILAAPDIDQSWPGDQPDVHLNCSEGLSISSVKAAVIETRLVLGPSPTWRRTKGGCIAPAPYQADEWVGTESTDSFRGAQAWRLLSMAMVC